MSTITTPSLLDRGRDVIARHGSEIRGPAQGRNAADEDNQIIQLLQEFIAEHPALNGQMESKFDKAIAELRSDANRSVQQANFHRDGG